MGSYKVNHVGEIIWLILSQRQASPNQWRAVAHCVSCPLWGLGAHTIDRFPDKLQAEKDNRSLHRISSWALNVLNLLESSQEGPNDKRSDVFHFVVWGWNKKTRARKSKGKSPLLSIPCLPLSALKKKKNSSS